MFVDDLAENCEGAEAVGMTAVLHRGADGTLDRLEELLRRQPEINPSICLQIGGLYLLVVAVIEHPALAAERLGEAA